MIEWDLPKNTHSSLKRTKSRGAYLFLGGYCERDENENYGKLELAIGYDVTDVWEAAEKSLTFPKKRFIIFAREERA